MAVQFLGSGDAFGSGARDQTCIYVNSPDFRFLIDFGASGLISMKRWGISCSAVDAILLTHLHGDHFGGIPFFILDAQLISKRTKPLVITHMSEDMLSQVQHLDVETAEDGKRIVL